MADPDCTVLAAETEEDAVPARLINGCPGCRRRESRIVVTT